jgi:DNA-directed RNA polymerase
MLTALYLTRCGDVIIFFDEKLLLLQEIHKQQNKLVYSVSLRNISRKKLAVKRFQTVSRLKIFGSCSEKRQDTPSIIEAGVKISQDYYIEHILENHQFEHAKNLHEEDYFGLQQDSALIHTVKCTQKGLKANLPDYFLLRISIHWIILLVNTVWPNLAA